MAEVKDKIVTVESLSALHDYNKENYAPKTDFTEFKSVMGYNTVDNHTIAFDANGRILWATSNQHISAGDLARNAPTTTKVVIGKTVTDINGGFAGLENIEDIYVYPDNQEVIIDAFLGGDTGLSGDRDISSCVHCFERNYTYLTDLLFVLGFTNMFDYAPIVLSSHQYGDELPPAGIKGRLFFKRLVE